MNKPSDLSFKPGAGEVPPFLAGRKEEKAEIKLKLDRLKNGNSPGQNIVLIGPRGNGKTVLLQWVKEEIGRYEGKVKCLTLLPHCFRAHDDLVQSLESLEGFRVKQIIAKLPFFEFQVSPRGTRKGAVEKPFVSWLMIPDIVFGIGKATRC